MPPHFLAVTHPHDRGNERHEELEERARYLAVRQNRYHVPHVRVTTGLRYCARPNFLGAINLTQAIEDGMNGVVLSYCAISASRVSVSALIACGGVHHHLVQHNNRFKVVLMVETGEAREAHHFCVLVGYGADAVWPYPCVGSSLQDWPGRFVSR